MNKSIKVTSLVIAMLSASGITYASDAIGPGDKDARWIVGGGFVTATNVYVGEDTEENFYLNLVFNGEHLFVKEGTINYSVAEWGNLSGGATLGYDANFLSFDSEYRDNAQLEGLQERDATVEGGFYLNHTTDLGRLNFTFRTDLGNKHDGHTGSLKYTFDLRAGNWYINPMLGVKWSSADKVDHYFGVSAAEATSTRLAYQGKSTYNYFLGVRARYELSDQWDLNLETGVNRLGSGVTNSSIVEEDTAYYSAISVNYAF